MLTRIEHPPRIRCALRRVSDGFHHALHHAVAEGLHGGAGLTLLLGVLHEKRGQYRDRALPLIENLLGLRMLADQPRPPGAFVADLRDILAMQRTDVTGLSVRDLHQFLLARMISTY